MMRKKYLIALVVTALTGCNAKAEPGDDHECFHRLQSCDFRQIWHLIVSRLGKTRCPGLASSQRRDATLDTIPIAA